MLLLLLLQLLSRHQLGEEAVGVGEKFLRRVVLPHAARVHHQDAVGIHDRVQPVGNRHHCGLPPSKLLSDGLLDQRVCFKVN